MKNRAQRAFFALLLLGVGVFLWMERHQLPVASPGTAGARTIPVIRPADQFTIVQKVKPGGYIGWHQSERDRFTASALQTRQTSHFYFVCQDQRGAERIFLVSERAYNAERVGNVLQGRDVSSFTEVAAIEEPGLPPNFEFRRREPVQR
jgi:hypothetical protein